MRMPVYRSYLLGLVCLMLFTTCARAPTTPVISGAWARPAEIGMNSAIYFTLENTAQDDFLLEARSDVAESVQLHKTIIDANGSASMQHQERVEVKRNQVVEFTPGGLHIMLLNLSQPLLTGDTFDLTLKFIEQGEIHVQVQIENN